MTSVVLGGMTCTWPGEIAIPSRTSTTGSLEVLPSAEVFTSKPNRIIEKASESIAKKMLR